MKLRCIECEKIHEVSGWISLNNLSEEKSICEIHLTCSCNNKMTVEHRHSQNYTNKNNKRITLSLGCEIIWEDLSKIIVPDYIHNYDDVLAHYFTGAVYDEWNTPTYVENYV